MTKKRKAKRVTKPEKPLVLTNRLLKSLEGLTTKQLVAKLGDRLIHAYKVTTYAGRPPYKPTKCPFRYKVGLTYKEDNPDLRPRESCSNGLHVASRHWCFNEFAYNLRKMCDPHRLFLVGFRTRHIACIPYNGFGKLRVYRFFILKELKVKRED